MEVSMSKTRRGKYTDNRICYISKCKGDMRLYLRRKGKLPCFSYLVRGKSFSFYRGKIERNCEKTKKRLNNIIRYGKILHFPIESESTQSLYLRMREEDKLTEQDFGMKTDGLKIRNAVGITLVDIASLESTQSLISIIFL